MDDSVDKPYKVWAVSFLKGFLEGNTVLVNRFSGRVSVVGKGAYLKTLWIDPDSSDEERWAQAVAQYHKSNEKN
jgi:hypothetical protein